MEVLIARKRHIASVAVPFSTVFGAMVSVHVLIGIGEGVITALAVRSVLAVRPDLVEGARGIELDTHETKPMAALTIGGVLVAFVVAMVVSQFAVDSPDGLETVAVRLPLIIGPGGVVHDDHLEGAGTPIDHERVGPYGCDEVTDVGRRVVVDRDDGQIRRGRAHGRYSRQSLQIGISSMRPCS